MLVRHPGVPGSEPVPAGRDLKASREETVVYAEHVTLKRTITRWKSANVVNIIITVNVRLIVILFTLVGYINTYIYIYIY